MVLNNLDSKEIFEELNDISKIQNNFENDKINEETYNNLIIEKIELLRILGLTNIEIQEEIWLNIFEFLLRKELKENEDIFIEKIINFLENREINNYFLKILSIDKEKFIKLWISSKNLAKIRDKKLEVIFKIEKEINKLSLENEIKNNSQIQELQEYLLLLGYEKIENINY